MNPQQPFQQSVQLGYQQQQGFSPQGAPIEATYTCDGDTARRLNRGAALITWRLPAKWGFLLALPAFLLARGTISILSDGGTAVISEMAGAFFLVVAFELVVVTVVTGVQLVRVNPKFTAIAGPGHRMSARYTDDTMHLWQTSGQVSNRYADIKRVITQGDVVFVQPRGTQGFVLPREVVPDAALTRLRGAA
ncbi:hypothetical protein [Nocardia neocaledoniensis]|uniref:hypothetical protein n=1 Tax=Nocardia neocaledoniensis TaxID=236511 RepID=UPI0024572ECC|nr:hypothetical protein [Nocardia neocaledoniensis]